LLPSRESRDDETTSKASPAATGILKLVKDPDTTSGSGRNGSNGRQSVHIRVPGEEGEDGYSCIAANQKSAFRNAATGIA
jgi:hypothetical protein